MILSLAVGILIVGRVGFSEILPESSPSRAAQTNMDQTAALGAKIVDANRFTVGSGIYAGSVQNNDSKLVWTKNADAGLMNWTNAMAYCTNLNTVTNCDFTTWRLPAMSDFTSLADDTYEDPALCNTSGNGQWAEGDAGTWTFATNSPVAFGGSASTPPVDTTAPAVLNQSTCKGFICNDFKAGVDWNFQCGK